MITLPPPPKSIFDLLGTNTAACAYQQDITTAYLKAEADRRELRRYRWHAVLSFVAGVAFNVTFGTTAWGGVVTAVVFIALTARDVWKEQKLSSSTPSPGSRRLWRCTCSFLTTEGPFLLLTSPPHPCFPSFS